ncbi:MAG: response regulator [Lachnospiraceae bacterium]|nr:response regulator [Lachnospiraceae bacterium]
MKFIYSQNLEPGMTLARDIISPGMSLMLRAGMVMSQDYIAYLQKRGYLGAYVKDGDPFDIEVEEPVTAKTMAESVKAVENADVDGLMLAASHIVSDISNMKKLSIDIIDLRSFDDYTYHHCVNVAIYCVAVAKYMGMNDKEIKEICEAGICHDLGKRKIPVDIINKPGSLTDAEFAEIKNHPQYSYDILRNNPDISGTVRQAVLCHHENENGSGYPLGKTGDELHPIVKILHAVDVYDALTSRRPYKNPYSPAEAYDYLIGGIDILFNRDVIDAMKMVIPVYPIATEVVLSNGEAGIVTDHTHNPMRPVVGIHSTGKKLNLARTENKELKIKLSGAMTIDYTGTVEKLNEKRQNVRQRAKEIMIVDDSIVSLKQTGAALANSGYGLITLTSGVEALNHIMEKGAPDLLIMDIEMPVLDGIKTVERVRELGYDDLPVIFLTGKGDRETVLKCREVSAKDYIIKPARPTYLRERVEVALDASLER